MLAFGLGPRACPAGSLSLLLAREMTNAALSAVELSPPPGRPVRAACPRDSYGIPRLLTVSSLLTVPSIYD
jgi:hypothetical protein